MTAWLRSLWAELRRPAGFRALPYHVPADRREGRRTRREGWWIAPMMAAWCAVTAAMCVRDGDAFCVWLFGLFAALWLAFTIREFRR